jgi:hypothetical protein
VDILGGGAGSGRSGILRDRGLGYRYVVEKFWDKLDYQGNPISERKQI